jgi:hypothetical protein
VEEASLPLVEGAAAEAVVRRTVIAGVVRHWSGCLELGGIVRRGGVGEVKWLANVAGQTR